MKYVIRCLILLVLASVLAGCFSGKTKPQSTYLLNIPLPKQQMDAKNPTALDVHMLEAFAPFTSNEFIYRISEDQYLSDYYHVFLVPVTEQISDITANYLMGQHLFGYVGSPLHPVSKAEYNLKGSVVALYADYRNSAKPKGVIAIRYILSLKGSKSSKVLMDKVFRQAVPLQSKTTTALLAAWNKGLSTIMAKLYLALSGIVGD